MNWQQIILRKGWPIVQWIKGGEECGTPGFGFSCLLFYVDQSINYVPSACTVAINANIDRLGL